jgi:hypothetical protein
VSGGGRGWRMRVCVWGEGVFVGAMSVCVGDVVGCDWGGGWGCSGVCVGCLVSYDVQ